MVSIPDPQFLHCSTSKYHLMDLKAEGQSCGAPYVYVGDKPKKQWMVNANCFAIKPSAFRLLLNIFRVLSLATTRASREDKENGLV